MKGSNNLFHVVGLFLHLYIPAGIFRERNCMELEIVSTIAVIYCYGYVIYYKLEFFEWTAICLDYRVGRSMTYYPEYVYELVENGETVTYKNWGFAVGFPRKGRKHRVLIKKTDHNKIVGYSEYITYKVVGTFMLILLVLQIIWEIR